MNAATLLICPLKLIPDWSARFPGPQSDGKRLKTFARPLKRSNGTCKSSDLDILESPRIYGLAMASIEATMACIITLLKRAMRFIIRITLNLMRYLKTWDKSYKKKLEAPGVLAFIVSFFKKKRLPPSC